MFKLNKINKQLLFGEYCNYSKDKWNDSYVYLNMSYKLANNLQFIYEFRKNIVFSLLYKYKPKINLQIVEDFVSLYDKQTWSVLYIYYSNIFNEEFINKHYMHIKYQIPYYISRHLDEDKLSDNAKFTLAMLVGTPII